MNIMRSWIVLCAATVGLICSTPTITHAAGPTTRPTSVVSAPRVQYVMSELRVQETPAVQFMSISEQTTGAKLRATIDSMLPRLTKLAKDAKAPIIGPCVFIYHQPSASGAFRIDAGFPVKDNATAMNGFTIQSIEAAPCATADFHGNASFLPEAHQKLLAQITAAGSQPGTEVREVYLHFSAAHESDVRLQVPLAGRESILAGHRTAD